MKSIKKASLSQRLKFLIIAWFESVSIHGLGNLVRSRHLVVKAIWFLFILASTAYCSYAIFENISDYLLYPVITQIDSKNEIPIQFPAVTLCTDNGTTIQYHCEIGNTICELTSSEQYVGKSCLSFNKESITGRGPEAIFSNGRYLDLTIYCESCSGLLFFVDNASISSFPGLREGTDLSTGNKILNLNDI